MPVVDTEFLFGLGPKDANHEATMKALSRGDLSVPSAAMLEFQQVLRARGRKPQDVAEAISAIRKIMEENDVQEGPWINSSTLVLQCEIEVEYGLSYFDSLIAATAMITGEDVISNDEDFDRIKGLTRIPLV